MKQCKTCGEWKDESKFYLKGHYVNGKYYVNFSGSCKLCYIENQKKPKKKEGNTMASDKILGCSLTICNDTNYLTVREQQPTDEFIYANLKRWGNCLVHRSRRIDYDELEKKLGKKIKRNMSGNCYILEVY